MKVADVMSPEVVLVSADATIREAARRMASARVSVLPVEENGALAGVITDGDITVRAAARGGNAGRRKVREIMTPGIHYCFDDQDVRAAAELMEEKQIRQLAVLNRSAELVGLVSVEDLALHADTEGLACEVIKMVAHPAPQCI